MKTQLLPINFLSNGQNIILFILIQCLSFQFVSAQSLSPSVLPASGSFYSSPNGSLSWTMGETVIQTLQAGTNVLTQGFQQPEVQVRTGTITGSYCQGNNIVVPFFSSGIINATNVFTAQLSNSLGSFSSPVNIGSITGNMTSGNINAMIPISTPLGSGYRIRVVSSLPAFVGPNNGTNISIVNTCSISVNLTMFLEGYYLGSSIMASTLYNEAVSLNTSITDSIQVELHNAASPFEMLATTTTLLNTDGTASCNFPISAGSYYIAVKHRNTVQTWSASPVALSTFPTSYNFSTASNKAYGDNMTQVSTGLWAFYSGDITQEENVDLLDASFLENDINNFEFGYFATDLNGDGNVDLLDTPILEENINNFVYSFHP